jgi:hypothetical protein
MFVCIVGVDHRIQWIPQFPGDQWRDELEKFIAYIQCQCEENGLELVAEEFSEYLVGSNRAVDSTARLAANRMTLPHLFCDPDPHERTLLGVQNYEDRENEWLRRLLSFRAQRILFICGDSHVNTFEARLVKLGHQANVLSRNWGQGWERID